MKDYSYIISLLRAKYPKALCSIGQRCYQIHDFEPIKTVWFIRAYDPSLNEMVIINQDFASEIELENYINTLEL